MGEFIDKELIKNAAILGKGNYYFCNINDENPILDKQIKEIVCP